MQYSLNKDLQHHQMKLSSSDRTGRLAESEEIQTRSSEDSKSLNVEQTHDRSGRPGKDTVAVQDDPEAYHEAETFVK